MKRMTALFCVILLVQVAGSSLQAQDTNTYRAPAESLYWVSDNPFRLYLVRGNDTIPEPVRGISVFRESWTPASHGFEVVRASVDVGLSTRTQTNTMSVSDRGEVLRINGQINYNEGEWDALLRLPAAPLEVGLEWSDTISHPTDGSRGPGIFEVRRKYRVARELDSGDGIRFEIEVEGDVEFDLSMWTDSVAGHYRWFELEGPMEETFVFDPVAGQLHARNWSMLLEGIGGDYDGVDLDTVAAGLRSDNSRYRIPEARAAALMSPLPGPDSSVTVRDDGTPLFVHTFGRESGRVLEGFKRPDGLIGTAEVRLAGGRPTRWTFTWVDLETDPRHAVYESRDQGLIADGERLEPPTPAWAVAEYGMVGALLPSLEALGEPQALPFSIYRPTPQQWDQVSVSRRRFEDFSLFVLSDESGGRTALLVNSDGVLLYEEVTNADASRRVRVPTNEDRQVELRRALAALQGGI